jgi:uncharacterized HAD superfamily protein
MLGPDPRRISDQLVRLVQVIFSLVVAQSLLLYRSIIIDPFTYQHFTSLVALLAVYLTTVWSWIDWHITMEIRPYDIHRTIEKARLVADLGVVITYAYLLFTIEPFIDAPESDIHRHLIGYPILFALYVASGLMRRRAFGPLATNLFPIVLAGSLTLALVVGYRSDWYRGILSDLNLNAAGQAVVTIGLTVLVMSGYRVYRAKYSQYRRAKKTSGLTVGIDVDGVLGDQIAGVLPRIKRRFDLQLGEADITNWRLPIDGSDIAKEIALALKDSSYISDMPVHEGAATMIHAIYDNHSIAVITARPDETTHLTERWLYSNRLWHDELLHSKEATKSEHETHILIDDYLGNVSEYLQNSQGMAILVDRPWNRDRKHVKHWIDEGRLRLVTRLSEVPGIIDPRPQDRPGSSSGADVAHTVRAESSSSSHE